MELDDRRTGRERRIMANGISRDTFMHMESDDKLAVLFDYVTSIHNRLANECPARAEACDKRFDALEQRRWYNTAASGVGGIIGGFIAITAKWLLESKG